MANPLQRAIYRRQAIYIGIIVGLFTLSMFWRGKFLLPDAVADQDRARELNMARRTGMVESVAPAANKLHALGDWVASRTIKAQAHKDALDLASADQGSADISGTAVRLGLTGMRGVAVTVLWRLAMEYQKRNEFHKLEQTVNAVTMLQPHFITPWLYQSWNITYNVSVENDRLTDAYYYIARGIELLAKGERLNRDSPDMRYNLAFFTQNKFSVSDKVITLRSLHQLSCIKPSDRNPDGLRDRTTQKIDMDRFRAFVRQNPILCRRLREKLNYTRPEEIIRFLADNQSVPTRYDKDRQDQLLPVEDQFPVLPPRFNEGPNEPNPGLESLDDTYDPFMSARAWFAYSLAIIPPPQADPSAPPIQTRADRFKYRMPKAPTLIIFRQGAPRAQTYLAEYLQKDGWFDANTRWNPDANADTPDQRWFDGTENLATTASSRDEWQKAYTMWQRHGERNGLVVPPEKLERLRDLATNVLQDERINFFSDEQLATLGLTREQIRARDFLVAYRRNLTTTNFEYFLRSAEAEQRPETVTGRALLFAADPERTKRRDPAAIRDYAKAQAEWHGVLTRNETFHRQEATEEHTYEALIGLMFMIEKSPELTARLRQDMNALQALVPAAYTGDTKDPVRIDFGRDLAEREAKMLVAIYDSRVQDRTEDLLGKNLDDATMIKDWPVVLKWKRALAAEAFERANKPPIDAPARDKAADDPAWRAKAVAAFLESRTKASVAAGWGNLVAAREEIGREVIAREYPWLPEYSKPIKSDATRWTRPDLVSATRTRLNLSKAKPSSAVPAPDTPMIR